jgi:hypothetical protein
MVYLRLSLLAALALALVTMVTGIPVLQWARLNTAGVLVPCVVLLILTTVPRPDVRAATAGGALGLAAFALITIPILMFGYFLGRGFGETRSHAVELALTAAVPIFVWMAISAFLTAKQSGQGALAMPTAVLTPIGLLLALAALGRVDERRTTVAERQNYAGDLAALARVEQIRLCLFQFSARHGEGRFPISLHALDEPGCAGDDGWTAGGYRFQYTPGPGSDFARAFLLRADALRDASHTTNVIGDETGLLSPYLGAVLPRFDHVATLGRIYYCALAYRQADPDHAYPRTIDDMRRVSARDRYTCEHLGTEIAARADYRFQYEPRTDGSAFTVEARPVAYGTATIRSYDLDDADSVIHATPYDRPATREDPVIPHCEQGYVARCFTADAHRPGMAETVYLRHPIDTHGGLATQATLTLRVPSAIDVDSAGRLAHTVTVGYRIDGPLASVRQVRLDLVAADGGVAYSVPLVSAAAGEGTVPPGTPVRGLVMTVTAIFTDGSEVSARAPGAPPPARP